MEIPINRPELAAALTRIAEAAYHAHNAALTLTNQHRLPEWHALPLSVQQCWLNAAVTVLVEARYSEPVLQWLREESHPGGQRPN